MENLKRRINIDYTDALNKLYKENKYELGDKKHRSVKWNREELETILNYCMREQIDFNTLVRESVAKNVGYALKY